MLLVKAGTEMNNDKRPGFLADGSLEELIAAMMLADEIISRIDVIAPGTEPFIAVRMEDADE